jgi:hypothetical protein
MMGLLMSMQIRLLVEALVAPWERAYEGLLPRMDPQVSLQIEVQGEALAALVTLVWFLTLSKKC